MDIKNKSQYGQSMFEMLGILSIIGVLSIFLLEIYTYLINKYHANILSDEILQRSLDVEKQLDNRKKNVSLAKFSPKSKLGYDITYDNISIGLQIFDVPKTICDMALDNIKNTLDVKIYSTDGQLLEECEENNNLIVLFKKTTITPTTKECPADTPKGADPNTCECDLTERHWEEATNSCICWSGEEINGICVKACTTSEDCKDNEVCEDHICIKIEQEKNVETSDIILTSDVGNNTKTTLIETSITTFETTEISSSTTLTETTSLWETTGTFETTEIFESTHTYTPTTTLYPETTLYQLVVTCPPSSPYFEINNSGNPSCLTNCPADKPVLSDRACCPLDKPIWHGSQCVSCVDRFGDKTPYWDGTQCTTCPSETPIWNGSQCVSCADHFGDKTPYWDGTQCTTCPSETPSWNGSQCVSCADHFGSEKPYWSNVKKTCVQCEPPTVFYIDRCLPCDYIYSSKISYNYETEECEPCPLEYRQVGSRCESCPSGTIADKNFPNQCISCATSYSKYKNVEGPYWDWGTKKCVKTCPSSRPAIDERTISTAVCSTCYSTYVCTSCIGKNPFTPIWNGTECITCEESNPSTPYWDAELQKCVSACPPEKPLWGGDKCSTCAYHYSSTPAWDGTKCTTCKLANPSTPYWDKESQQCLAQCPTERPYWDGTSCLSSCPTDKPYWNGSQCVSCSSQYGTNYYYNTDTKQCVYCANAWYQNKCFIPSSCSNFGLSQGYKIDSTNGGCYGLKEQNKGLYAWCDRDHPGPCIVEASGYIVVPQSGTYTFFASEVLGDHGIINSYTAYIDGERMYYTKNGGQEGSKERNFSTYLTAGIHRYSVSFSLSKRIAAGFYSVNGDAMLCH